jgi:PKD repeat protein
MKLRNHVLALAIALIIILMVGCQGGGTPVAPNGAADKPGQTNLVPANQSVGGWSGGHHLLTLVNVRIDAQTGTVDVSPLRTAEQHLNMLELIPIYCHPATSCLDFINLVIDMPTATCDLDIVVNHPIPDPYTDVYDMRGIGIFKGTLNPGFSDGKVATQILNADGYTTAYDMGGVYDAFLNPYVAFNKDVPLRKFAHSSQSTRHITCRFPSLAPEDAQFYYALDASWADPTQVNPDDPLTSPNIPEPYQVNVLYTDKMSDQFLAEATAVVEIYDWQNNAAGVELECPDLVGGAFDMTSVWSSEGRSLFYMNIVNDSEPAPGAYPFLVKAKDEFESQPDLVNPTIQVDLTNYQLGQVTVYDSDLNTAPVASVVADETSIKAGQWVHFDASASTDAEDGTVSSYAWDLNGDWVFDEGNEATAEYHYITSGEYAANVMVTDTGGLTDILDLPIIITVGESINTPPVASAFASDYDPSKGQLVTLDASNSSDAEDIKPISWQWDLDGDNDFDDDSGEVIQTSWDTAGYYQVDVKVTDSGGLTDTLDTKLQIHVLDTSNTPPVAMAHANKPTAAVGELILFDATDSYDPEDGNITMFAWDLLGKKTYDTAFLPIVPYKYWAPGIYEVDLRVTDSGGLTDTLDTPLTIEITGAPNQPPVAVATASDDLVYVDELIHFDATGSFDPEEGAVKIYAWDLTGDGDYNDAFTPEVDWAYSEPGVYDVNVRVTDTPGLSDTLDKPLVIQVLAGSNTAPVAIAKADKTYVYTGDTVNFDGSGSYDKEDGAPTSWGWEFDGDDDYNDSPFIVAAWTYNDPGVFQVDLKVTDKDGAFDTLDVPITITVVPAGSNFPPEAIGSVNCAFPFVGQSVHFTNQSMDPDGSVVKWEWNFDDTTGWHDFTATEGDTWHAFSDEGIYQVQLRVTDDKGATDELDAPISVFSSLSSFIPPGEPPGCAVGSMAHMYAASMPLMTPNTTTTSRDLAFLSDGSYMMVVADALYRCMVPAMLMEPAIMYSASWVKSIDATNTGLVALSGLSDGIVKVYAANIGPTMTLDPVADIDVGQPVQAVTFDDADNVWVYTQGRIQFYASPSYGFDACKVYDVSEIETYGTVDDMDFDPWNHSLYLAVNDGGNGTVVEVNYLGKVDKVKTDVLLGPSHYMDIVVDKVTLLPETQACRIEVFGGISRGYVTRLDADLTVLDSKIFGFWGVRAATLSPMPTNEVIALEDCCVSWVDFLIPSPDWSDYGG